MKIIKRCKKQRPNVITFACCRCGCVFEATNEEYVTEYIQTLVDLPIEAHYLINCPECGAMVEIHD